MADPARSEAARAASRRNGRKSRGPRTTRGKIASARNALKHGLRARQNVEPEFLPVWVKHIERRVIACVGYLGIIRREAMDRALQSIMLLGQVDRLIAEEQAVIAAQLAAADFGQRLQAGSIDLDRLRKLMAYRSRFRASRDKALYRFTIDGIMTDPAMGPAGKSKRKSVPKPRSKPTPTPGWAGAAGVSASRSAQACQE